MKSIIGIAATVLLTAGTAGIASADNATSTPPSNDPTTTQQQIGATTAAPVPATAAAPTTAPVTKKKERVRRAERGTRGLSKPK
jgi:hypothetical protein